MFLCVIKWLALIPVSFATTLASWLVAPVAPLFRDENYRLPSWLAWCSTPTTNLLGDTGHQARFAGKNKYFQMVWWIMRNPGVVAQKRPPLGCEVLATDRYEATGDEETRDNNGGHSGRVVRKIIRNGQVVAWQLYIVRQYGTSAKCLRVCLGWKIWANPEIGYKPQHSCRITVWKSFG